MTTDPAKLEHVFDAARALSWFERGKYLDDACGGDAEMRTSVESLLRAHDEAAHFLETQAAAPPAPGGGGGAAAAPILEGPGASVGRYKILQQIGEGGMAVVFLAEQTRPIQRKVALKIIKPGMDSRQIIARFEAERQALALMEHEHIAKVFDAGTTASGRPYFVMELVKGVPITSYCDERRLPPRARLELFVQVCSAVQHAHQKGIIHRDIKPSNVLVALHDGKPVPKVIDFGIAKATGGHLTDRTLFTGFGAVLGTPEYMSPEQAELNQLDVDTRSDIYSLGVLLYELLTGTTPLESRRVKEAAILEVLRVIREEEPPKPSTRLTSTDRLPTIAACRGLEPRKLSTLVHGELDWIVMKALEKDRARRYETASGFARDVEHYLRDEPVLACPPSASYRFRKFARRHRRAFVAASLGLVALLMLVAGLAVSNRMIARERNQKAESQALAEAQAKRAQHNFWRASIAIRELMTKTAMGRDDVPVAVRKRFSEEAIKYFQALLKDGSADPTLRYETGVGYRTLGMLHATWKNFGEAEKCYRQSIDILSALAAEQPGVEEYRHQLAYAHQEFGGMLKNTWRLDESKRIYANGERIYVELLAEVPQSYDYAFELATLERGRFNLLRVAGPIADAERAYRKSVELFTRLAEGRTGPDPYPAGQSKATLLNEIANLHRTYALALSTAGRFDDGDAVLVEAIKTFDAAHGTSGTSAEAAAAYQVPLGNLHSSLGQLRALQGRLEQARHSFQDASARYERAFSASKSPEALYSWVMSLQGWMELPIADPHAALAGAEPAYRRVRDIRATTPAELQRSPRLREHYGHVHRIWGFICRRADRDADALLAFREAAPIFNELATQDPGQHLYPHFEADTHRLIGETLLDAGQEDEAEKELRRSVMLHQRRAQQFPELVVDDGERCAAYACLARLLVSSGRSAEAATLLKDALDATPKDQRLQTVLTNVSREVSRGPHDSLRDNPRPTGNDE